jgi:hypothetical protein
MQGGSDAKREVIQSAQPEKKNSLRLDNDG